MGHEWGLPLVHENLDMPIRVPYKTYETSFLLGFGGVG